jgi:hypothetical protein
MRAEKDKAICIVYCMMALVIISNLILLAL